MSVTTVYFNGKAAIEPGSYSRIIGGVKPPIATQSDGAIVMIDTGIGAGFGGGAGINGEISSKKIYELTNYTEAANFLRGGVLSELVDYLFNPDFSSRGVEKIYYVRAATTVAAKATLNWATSAGSITIAARNEGTVGNGSLIGTVLTRGFGVRLRAGVNDSSAFILDFYQGRFKGLDADNFNLPYEIAESKLTNSLILSTKEFKNNDDLIAILRADETFNSYFAITASTASTTTIANSNLTTYGTAINLFTGGTTSYSGSDLDTALQSIENLNYSAVLSLEFGANANSANNVKIISHLKNDSPITEKTLYVGLNDSSLTAATVGSIPLAKYFNSSTVVGVHGNIQIATSMSNGLGYKTVSALYTAAMVCGRVMGLPAQVPATQKTLSRIVGVPNELSLKQRENALLNGVLHIKNDITKGYVINQAINTFQTNDILLTPDGQGCEIQLTRIIHQLNKEIVFNSNKEFPGENLRKASKIEVIKFVQRYLESRTVTDSEDNLILNYENVDAVLSGDCWKATYGFYPNIGINKMFFTGVVLDPSVIA